MEGKLFKKGANRGCKCRSERARREALGRAEAEETAGEKKIEAMMWGIGEEGSEEAVGDWRMEEGNERWWMEEIDR